jgi:uncharacterized repeat protein (TIGR03803 family)
MAAIVGLQRGRIAFWALAISLAIAALASGADAADFKVLHRFKGGKDGESPLAGLVADDIGDLYGTTAGAGGSGPGKHCAKSCGNGYEFLHGGGHHVIFTLNGKDGSNPTAPLLYYGGNFYGTTAYGGKNDGGVIFRFEPDGSYRVLYNFCAQPQCTDGYVPSGALIADGAGNLYGTTFIGGANNGGAIFELSASGVESVLYSFCSRPNCTDGTGPLAGLIADAAGNFYGTTERGGTGCNGSGCGTAFELTPGGAETVLYSFCSRKTCEDGSVPMAPLVADASGNFYGTTTSGGRYGKYFYDDGVVFKLAPDGTESVLYSFCRRQSYCADGANPEAGLTFDTAGNLYGTTLDGGTMSCGCGTVFRLAPDGKETVLHAFGFADGTSLQVGVLLLQEGDLLGTAPEGGQVCHNLGYGCGTVFEVKTK